ncbi:LuxR C-terminal-related transcriptional regulator [Micromonospora sp. URMC 107]|uniref:LuxR C-terminal-related transcriptional regulator n=1 Tax=Micromonospora sp. URMC 107 TaxID=3423418 RepID=UPI003F1B5414
MRDDQWSFPDLGLSPGQQALYESLVASPGPVSADVAGTADFARLAELGLATRLPGQPPRWTAVAPDVALGPLLTERRESLRELRQRVTRMADRFQRAATAEHSELVEVLHGRDAIHAAFQNLKDSARQELLIFDAPPYLNAFALPAEEAERRQVRMRTIYDREGMAIPGRLAQLARFVSAGEHARVADVPMKLMLCDRQVGLVPLRPDLALETCLLVRDSVLLSALSALFESLWERAVPLDVGVRQRVESDPDAPSDLERDLLALLVAGLTEQDVAEHLGCHARTVRRHMNRLFARLDAVTRFQAGYQAVQRGWLTAEDREDLCTN